MGALGYKVCYLTRQYANPVAEGVNQASIRIIDSTRRSGLGVKIFSFEPFGVDNVNGDDITIVKTLFHESLPGRRTLRKLAYSLNLQAVLSSSFLSLIPPCDILHILPPVSTTFYAMIIRLLQKVRLKKCDFKVVTHVFHPFHPIMGGFAWEGIRTFWRQKLWFLRHARFDQIFCINRLLENFVRGACGKSAACYLPYPVDIASFRPPKDKTRAKKMLGLPTDKFLVGYIGQVYAKRGIHVLLDAFDMATRDLPDLILVIATKGLSQDKPHVRSFFDHLKRVKPKNRILVLNRVLGDVQQFYQAMDLIILPFTEPYSIIDPPVVVTETLASGVPLITTPVGAIKEITSNDRSAIYVPIADASTLGEEIIRLACDSHLRARLGSQARKAASTRSLESIGKRLARKYEELLI